jgi:hypothetical protein
VKIELPSASFEEARRIRCIYVEMQPHMYSQTSRLEKRGELQPYHSHE